MKKPSTRNSVRIILINSVNKLLLVYINNSKIKSIGKKHNIGFWVPIGGEIQKGENEQQAAARELYEETGLNLKDVVFGPVVWQREIDLEVDGKIIHFSEKYLVAKTKKSKVLLNKNKLDPSEKSTLKKLKWFSFSELINSKRVIYPVLLSEYLGPILDGKYPSEPVRID